jgi:hypothetical protein
MLSVKRLQIGLAVGVMVLSGFVYAESRGRGGDDRGRGGYDRGGHGGSRVGFGLNIVIGAPRYHPVYICPPPRPVYYYEPAYVYAPQPVVVVPQRTVVVQQPPVVVQQPAPVVVQQPAEEQTVVWISNDNGSKTPVTLVRQRDTGYFVGPRGEIYVVLPTDEQLRSLYGLPSNTVKQTNLTLWITNDNGSKTPVSLTPSNGGFVGPSGEFYASLPTEGQLKAAYGLPTDKKQENTTVVYVDNGDKKMPVVLTKEGTEFVGPNGEHYAAIPSKDQLQAVYGKTVATAAAANTNSITIWLENNGTKMPVTLQKQGANYLGPNGEQYSALPTADQLKPIYAPADGDQVGIQITKTDGTQTVVTLTRKGTEYVGQNGETYATMPTEEQLKKTYGK